VQIINKEQKIETSTETAIVGNTVLAAVRQFESLDEQLRDYIYPKLYTLYKQKKLNEGRLPPHKSAKESVTIREFCSDGKKISVHIDIWWGSNCYDYEWVTMSADEWDDV